MVVLGFRPKVLQGGSSENVMKVTKAKAQETVKENIEKGSSPQAAQTQSKKAEVHLEKKTPAPAPAVHNYSSNTSNKASTYHSNLIKTKSRQVSSNWKSLQSKNAFTADAIKSSKSGPISDADWFNVNLSAIDPENEPILRENVSVESLFPPTPSNMTSDKLEQACKYVALDCEMVGVGMGGKESVLARVSVVNFHGKVLLDVYVRSNRKVSDFRTAVSGITPAHITASRDDPTLNNLGHPLLSLNELQERLVPILSNRYVVGHALSNDFSALLLSSNHPRRLIRDTSRYRPFRALNNGRNPSLKFLAGRVLGVRIQKDSHDSVDDARVAMLLYRAVKNEWENLIFRGDDRKSKNSQSKQRRRNNNSSDSSASDSESENDS